MFSWTVVATGFLKEVFDHDKVKEFKQEFIGAAVDWIKPLFLEDIPEDEQKDISPEKIEERIAEMSSDPVVLEKLEQFVQQSKETNLITDLKLTIKKGNVKIGHNSKKDDVSNTLKNNDISIEDGDFTIGGS